MMIEREDERRLLRRPHGRAGSIPSPGDMGGFEPQTCLRDWSEEMRRSTRRWAMSTEVRRYFREKSRSGVRVVPVPQTDTGWQVEHTKALREPWLRNSAKWRRNFGRRRAGACVAGICSHKRAQAAVARGQQLFIKNTGPCELVKEDV